jgi:HlyD family secretion protein
MEREEWVKRFQFIFILILVAIISLPACRNEEGQKGIVCSGTVEAIEVFVRAEVSGRVVSFTGKEGELVKKGELIAEIDTEQLEITKEEIEGEVAELNARLTLLKKGARAEEIKRAEAAKDQALAQLTEMRREFVRVKQLVATEALPKAELDRAETRLKVAEKGYEQAEKNYQLVKKGARLEEIKIAEAALTQARARLKSVETDIDRAKVKSPRDGIVAERLTEVGEFLTRGSLIAKIVDLKKPWVKVYVSEIDFGKIRLGDQAEVRIDAFPERVFIGRVSFLSPEAEFTPKEVETKEERLKLVFGVKVTVENDELYLKPGLPADVVIIPEGN